jgi:hypothetical protein
VMIGRNLRDAAIDSVLAGELPWSHRYQQIVLPWFDLQPMGYRFIGETLRTVARCGGLAEPHHVNAWGGVSSAVLRRWLSSGQTVACGMEQAKRLRSHAHVYRQYEKIDVQKKPLVRGA